YLNTYQNKLLHIDMYRLETKEQLHETGLLEQITLYEYILIERTKREELYADESRVKLEITKEKDGGRNLHLSNYS
ncbi:tRNA (adenosine(37)-N6)-threonylcarbamoyltransferase complex ATPase subunit type 1 TsaE, partial [Patescibacteria group bacterium]|nr:tRNA (adenosine(37)-N6)-threonylcarbamoyltransferase complex ATPase subunit type 1 TsaE [Patescibacteria group bacterium]